MKYPKIRCAVVVLFASLVSLSSEGASAEPKGSPGQANNSTSSTPSTATEERSDNRGAASASQPSAESRAATAHRREVHESVPASNPRPAAPSNVRIKVQTSSPATQASGPAASAVDPSSLPTGRSRTSVAAAIDAQNFAPTLRAATPATRGKLITDVESRIVAAEGALEGVEKSTAEISADGRAQFKAATIEAREKAKALRRSMEVARGAADEEWEGARAQIAADYHAYAAALSRIDSALGIAPPGR